METLHESTEEVILRPDELVPDDHVDLSWLTPARIMRIVDVAVIVLVVGFILGQLGLGNILKDNTPAGGDMGAHVWGPAFLRDHLLPNFRLSGWAPDWYDGFPAYQFYMVLPALMIVALNAGWHGFAALVPFAAAVTVGIVGWRRYPARSFARRTLVSAAVVIAVLGIGLPYGVAFKVITVAGILSLPIAAYALGRLADLPFPTPAMFAIAMLPFLFNREPLNNGTGNIIGGNITSTLAGEFSFSLSLTFGVLFLGVLVAGFRTGKYRWLAAVLLALTALCHVIVAIFVFVAALAALVVWPAWARVKWLAVALPIGGLLSAFWTFPFYARSAYVNDMGWEKLPSGAGGHSWNYLVGQFVTDGSFRDTILKTYLAPKSLQWIIALAVVGLVVSFVLRIRIGLWFGLNAVLMAFAFIAAPESRLWNARLLPFYYLMLCLLAAIGVAELARAIALLVARDPEQPVLSVNIGALGFALMVAVIVVGLPLRALPGETSDAAGFHWQPELFGVTLPLPTISTSAPSDPAPDWARWNYTGYEGKPAYPEYYRLATTMEQVSKDHGCGRAMWEYDDPRLERYGTPMAPMLLSLFTDGCIGSMEGLYFESSTTTPYHFINQDELSAHCSCAQRNLPYKGFDLDLGIEHLQMLGVKYYLASTPNAVLAAAKNPNLHEIATSGSGEAPSCATVGGCAWHIYEVSGSDLVTPLANEPAVVTDHNAGLEWTYGTSDPHTAPKDSSGKAITANGPAMTWYLDPQKWNVYLAADGPSSWTRVKDGETPPARPLPKVEVTNIKTANDTIDFDVDQVGTPVLVRTSYFPNWKVDGADGPYRVTPNLMVVVPTSNHVHLHYGNTGVEYLAWLLTFIGIGLVIFIARRKPVQMPEPAPVGAGLLSRLLTPEGELVDDDALWDGPIWPTDAPPVNGPPEPAVEADRPPDEERPSSG
ncbi:MAG TPA: hypothetical protein VFV00_10015 [Acidimicrobiales bacterium]|nr:hypothetical protein [Acidimicrobiales bacterium]